MTWWERLLGIPKWEQQARQQIAEEQQRMLEELEASQRDLSESEQQRRQVRQEQMLRALRLRQLEGEQEVRRLRRPGD